MNISNFIKSLLAGMIISVAATAYLSIENIIVGGIFFSVGLLTIYLFDWNLYTGKCCYVPENLKVYLPITIMAFIGNLIGTVITGYLLRFSNIFVVNKAQELIAYKLNNSYLESFILAIFCGILMCIAVLGYKKQSDDFGRAIIVILPITVFIISKFEHVIANMFYISVANKWDINTFLFTLICALGNAVGCSIIPLSRILINKTEK